MVYQMQRSGGGDNAILGVNLADEARRPTFGCVSAGIERSALEGATLPIGNHCEASARDGNVVAVDPVTVGAKPIDSDTLGRRAIDARAIARVRAPHAIALAASIVVDAAHA